MTRSSCQLELFEGFAPSCDRAPRLALPFQRSKEIDIARVRQILGVNQKTAMRMLERGLIRGYRHAGIRANWHVEYDSVVEYCEQLRILHCISDARAGVKPHQRRRDRDLLPFPLDETVTLPDVCRRLDMVRYSVVHLIEIGALVGYQVIFEQHGCPWRIHAPSLERYLASLHAMASKKPTRQTSPASR